MVYEREGGNQVWAESHPTDCYNKEFTYRWTHIPSGVSYLTTTYLNDNAIAQELVDRWNRVAILQGTGHYGSEERGRIWSYELVVPKPS